MIAEEILVNQMTSSDRFDLMIKLAQAYLAYRPDGDSPGEIAQAERIRNRALTVLADIEEDEPTYDEIRLPTSNTPLTIVEYEAMVTRELTMPLNILMVQESIIEEQSDGQLIINPGREQNVNSALITLEQITNDSNASDLQQAYAWMVIAQIYRAQIGNWDADLHGLTYQRYLAEDPTGIQISQMAIATLKSSTIFGALRAEAAEAGNTVNENLYADIQAEANDPLAQFCWNPRLYYSNRMTSGAPRNDSRFDATTSSTLRNMFRELVRNIAAGSFVTNYNQGNSSGDGGNTDIIVSRSFRSSLLVSATEGEAYDISTAQFTYQYHNSGTESVDILAE
jgi:hypothetical protein